MLVSGMQRQDGGTESRGKLPLEGGREEGDGWGRERRRRKKENSDVNFALPFETHLLMENKKYRI